MDVDVAIVGAGPAGAAAALRALQLDPTTTVALIDKAAFPRDKVCGDGLGPEGVEVLRDLGVADEVLAGYPPIRRVRITAPSGLDVRGETPRAGYVIPRAVLDHRLRDAAVRRGAIPLRHRLRRLTVRHDGIDLDGVLRARTLIGADGANSVVRRLVGAPPQARDRTGLAMRGYVDADRDELLIGFVADRWPAYVWAFPTGTGRVNVGYGPFDATTVGARHDLERSLARWLPEAEAATELRAHHLPLSTQRPVPAVGRVLLAGDAASLINPLTGEGIYYALLSGALAGAAAVRAPADPAGAYVRALRRRLGRHLRHTALAARAFRRTLPVELSVAAARRDPATFGALAEFALGTGLVTPRMVAGLTRAAVRRAFLPSA